MKISIQILMLLCIHCLFSQQTISGYVNSCQSEFWESKIHLSKVDLKNSSDSNTFITIATSKIREDGYFSFEPDVFTEENQLYKLSVNPGKATQKRDILKAVKNYKLLILSKNDTVYFDKGSTLFGTYTTNSKADKEWKKLRNFESEYDTLTTLTDTEEYLLKTRGYVKDSLEILLIKLIGIKKLDEKKLLETDIQKNTIYYTDLLSELRSSKLDPRLFLFLENNLLSVTGEIIKTKYVTSFTFNLIGLLTISILGYMLFQTQKEINKTDLIPLSKQELVIKELIISGKSNKEIANELFISVSTVKTHISNIYSKLQISNRKQLLK